MMTLSDLLRSIGQDPSAITVVHDNAICPSHEMLESSSQYRRLRKSRRLVHSSTTTCTTTSTPPLFRSQPTTAKPPASRWDAIPVSPEKLYSCSARNACIKGGTATHNSNNNMTLNSFARIGSPPLRTSTAAMDSKKRQWGENASSIAGSCSISVNKPSYGNAASGIRKSCLPLQVPTRRYSHEDTASLLQRALAEIDFSDDVDEE
jgi:hypothetical protein